MPANFSLDQVPIQVIEEPFATDVLLPGVAPGGPPNELEIETEARTDEANAMQLPEGAGTWLTIGALLLVVWWAMNPPRR